MDSLRIPLWRLCLLLHLPLPLPLPRQPPSLPALFSTGNEAINYPMAWRARERNILAKIVSGRIVRLEDVGKLWVKLRRVFRLKCPTLWRFAVDILSAFGTRSHIEIKKKNNKKTVPYDKSIFKSSSVRFALIALDNVLRNKYLDFIAFPRLRFI